MQSSLITYQISAALLCHDVRLNTHIQIKVTLDYPPSPAEAESLLWPEAERVVARNFCEDCPYELYGIEVVAMKLSDK